MTPIVEQDETGGMVAYPVWLYAIIKFFQWSIWLLWWSFVVIIGIIVVLILLIVRLFTKKKRVHHV
jgi:hypothetical protein